MLSLSFVSGVRRLIRRPRRPATVLLALALALAPAPGCGPGAGTEGEGRGVLVICIDALRADHLSGLGYDRPTTPRLDNLASAGVTFLDAWSTAPWNLPACASLLTGCDPYVSRRLLPEGIPSTVDTRWNVPRQAPRLAQEFLRAGWATAAFMDDPLLSPVRGFTFGFESFQTAPAEEARARGSGLADKADQLEAWLRGQGRDRSWFAFVHVADLERLWRTDAPGAERFFEPRAELASVPPIGDAEHLFHAIPRSRWAGGIHTLGEYEARYDDALRRLDGDLGRLLQRLARIGRLADTTLVVVGSHGLGFGEAGLILDHGTLSEVDLRVPWILVPAADAGIEPGQRVAALASLIDVAPTVLELAGLGAPTTMHGLSFAPLLRGGGTGPREFAVARAGFQDGYAVIEPRWILELTRPWVVEEPSLERSWYGGPRPAGEGTREVLLARDGELPDARTARTQALRLCALGAQWLREVERLRGGLQTVDWLLKAGLELEPDGVVLGPCAGPAGLGAAAR